MAILSVRPLWAPLCGDIEGQWDPESGAQAGPGVETGLWVLPVVGEEGRDPRIKPWAGGGGMGGILER